MSQHFDIGEIAIVAKSDVLEFPVGAEVPVLSELKEVQGLHGYLIGEILRENVLIRVYARPEDLRKRRPPQDPAFVKFRDELVREFAMDARSPVRDPHPAIASMLQLVGQGLAS